MVDALGSGPSGGNSVEVRVLSRAPRFGANPLSRKGERVFCDNSERPMRRLLRSDRARSVTMGYSKRDSATALAVRQVAHVLPECQVPAGRHLPALGLLQVPFEPEQNREA